nr:MAG TPA: tail tape measure [Caudoviricetes sp.]
MNTVDQRIVEMQFNNSQFERGIKESTESLDRFKASLDLDGSSKGLTAIADAAQNIDLSRIADAAEAVANRFSFMGNMVQNAYGQMINWINGVSNAALQLGKDLTITPVSTGLNEYETQINAIQTILSNTRDAMTKAGMSESERLANVNEHLDKLNHYADKTIYNFTEMTRNIGTFTAAGVDIDTATNSIQGIANLAAVSGSTSEQASRGMYQLSQAISTGTVKLQDWNSVVNAGMGGEVFQNALKRTAKAMNVVVDGTEEYIDSNGKRKKRNVKKTVSAIIDEAGSFRESLSQGWLSSDVLTKTLEQFSWDFEEEAKAMGYTEANIEEGIAKAMNNHRAQLMAENYDPDEIEEILAIAKDATDAATKVKTFTQLIDTLKEAAQSGWTQTWQYIIGDFNEAKELWSSISDHFGKIIDRSAEARNELMAGWKNLGGRDLLIQSFWNIVEAIENVVNTVRGEFEKIFPKTTDKQLFSITSKFELLTRTIRDFTKDEEKMDAFRQMIGGIASAFGVLKRALQFVGGVFLDLGKALAPAIVGLSNLVGYLGDFLSGIYTAIESSGAFKTFITAIGNAIGASSETVVNAFKGVITWVGALVERIKNTGIVQKVIEHLTSFINRLPETAQRIKDWGQNLLSVVKDSETFKTVSANAQGFFSSVYSSASGFFSRILSWIKTIFGKDGISGIKKTIRSFFSSLGMSAGTSINGGWAAFKKSASKLFRTTIPGFFSKVITGIRDAWTGIDLSNPLRGLWDFISAAFKTLSESFGQSDIIEDVKAFVFSIGDAIREIWGKTGSFDNWLFKGKGIGEGTFLGDARASISAWLAGFKSSLTSGWAQVKTYAQDFFSQKIPSFFENIGSLINGFFDQITLDNIGKMAAIVKTLFQAFGAFRSGIGLFDMGKGVKSAGKGIKQIGEGIKDFAENGVKITKVDKRKDAIGTTILKIAGAIGILVAAMVVLSRMDTQDVKKSMIIIGLLGLELSAIGAVFKGGGLDGKSFLQFAAGLTLLLIPLGILGKMNTSKLTQGIIAIGFILGEIALFTRIAKQTKDGKTQFISMSAGILILTIALKRLAKMDTGSLIKSLTALGVLFIEIGYLSKKTSGKKMSGLIAMAIAMNLMARALKTIGRMKTGAIIKGVAGMAGIVFVMGRLTKDMGGQKLSSMVVMVAGVAALLYMFIETFKAADQLDATNMLSFTGSMSAIMLGISGAIKVMGNIPWSTALMGIAKLGVIFAALAGIMSLLGWAEQGLGLSQYINSFGDLCESMGVAIGRLIGGLGQGITSGLNLPQMGQQFSDFMTNFQPFLDGAKGIDSSVVDGVGNLATALVMIGGSEIVNALASWVSGENAVVKFKDDIGTIGEMLTNFSDSISGFSESDQSAVDNAIDTAKGLAEVINSVPWDLPDGLKNVIGSRNAQSFAKNIEALADGLATYASKISGFDTAVTETDITNSTRAAMGLAELEKSLTRKGGLGQGLRGVQDLGDFASKLPGFAEGMKTYATNIKGFATDVSDDDISKSTNAARGLAELEKVLEPQGGMWDGLNGIKDLGDFSEKIPGFAESMRAYATSIKDFSKTVSQDDIDMSTACAQGLSDLEATLPAVDGVVQWFDGSHDLGKFSEEIVKFAEGLQQYALNVQDFSVKVQQSDVDNATIAVDAMVDLVEALPNEGGFWDNIGTFFGGDQNIVAFSEKMVSFSENFKSFATNISGLTDVITDFDTVKSVMNSFVAMSSGIENSDVSTEQMGDTAKTLAEVFTKAFTNGISGSNIDVGGAARNLAAYGAREARTKRLDWWGAGVWLATGLRNGISSMASSIRTAAVNAAAGAIRAISLTWQVHSPSRVGYELGAFLDKGLSGGIDGYSQVVAQSASGVGRNAAASMRTALSSVNWNALEGIDDAPSIRPVLDLGGIESGIDTMGGLFDRSYTLGAGFQDVQAQRGIGNLGFDGARISGSQTGNSDVVNELRALRSRFDEMQTAISNMQIVLDTGVLVGATSASMDDQLGTLAMRRGRGN